MKSNKIFLIFFLILNFTKSSNSQVILSDTILSTNKDTSINGVLLLFEFDSIIKYLDPNFLEKQFLPRTGKHINERFNFLIYTNSKGDEYLKIVSSGTDSWCSYFEVGYVKDLEIKNGYKKTKFKNFITNRNIKLGKKNGHKFDEELNSRIFSYENQIITIIYQEGVAEQRTQIPWNKAPSYISIYKFKYDGSLIKFGFGYMSYYPE